MRNEAFNDTTFSGFQKKKQGHLQLEQYQFDTDPPHRAALFIFVQNASRNKCRLRLTNQQHQIPKKSTDHVIK